MKIHTVARPYRITFHNSGHEYAISSEEAQRLIDAYPAIIANRNRVMLRGSSGRVAARTTIRPATRGGGPAFIIEKEQS